MNRSRNRRGEGALLRTEIVDAAVALLDESCGQQPPTLRSIARRAGIAAPSIYLHFPDQPAIMIAVVGSAFTELMTELTAAAARAGAAPRPRLEAMCHAYLEFARDHPQRYRTMFGGPWPSALGDSSVTEADLTGLGASGLRLLTDAIRDCVAAGISASADPAGDAVALWIGLHGLAHQRAVSRVLPGPPDTESRIVSALARLLNPRLEDTVLRCTEL